MHAGGPSLNLQIPSHFEAQLSMAPNEPRGALQPPFIFPQQILPHQGRRQGGIGISRGSLFPASLLGFFAPKSSLPYAGSFLMMSTTSGLSPKKWSSLWS